MNHLIFPACVAALFHALFLLISLPSPPVPPSAATHGTTITVSMTVPSVQSLAAATPLKEPEPVKEKPHKKKPVKPKKVTPRHVKKKKGAKARQKGVPPVEEVTQLPPPEMAPESESVLEETLTQKETAAQVTATNPKEIQETAASPTVGGTHFADQPTPVYAPEPRYPKAAIRRGYQGVVLLDILVNGDGHVEELKIKGSSGHSVLDRSAVKEVKKWRFSATGAVTSTWVTLPLRFKLKGT